MSSFTFATHLSASCMSFEPLRLAFLDSEARSLFRSIECAGFPAPYSFSTSGGGHYHDLRSSFLLTVIFERGVILIMMGRLEGRKVGFESFFVKCFFLHFGASRLIFCLRAKHGRCGFFIWKGREGK